MGKGIAYKHSHFMLYAEEHFQIHKWEVTCRVPHGVQLSALEEFAEEHHATVYLNEENSRAYFEITLGSFNEAKRLKDSLGEYNACNIACEKVPDPDWDHVSFDAFLNEVAALFDTDVFGRRYLSNEIYVFAETDLLEIGIDTSGATPCLFVAPKKYTDHDREIPFCVDHTVQNAFNLLIESYNIFSYPTSAWTSEKLTKYERNA